MAAAVHPELDVASYVVLITIRDLTESRPSGVRAADVAEALRLHKSTMSRNITVLDTSGCSNGSPHPMTPAPGSCASHRRERVR